MLWWILQAWFLKGGKPLQISPDANINVKYLKSMLRQIQTDVKIISNIF